MKWRLDFEMELAGVLIAFGISECGISTPNPRLIVIEDGLLLVEARERERWRDIFPPSRHTFIRHPIPPSWRCCEEFS